MRTACGPPRFGLTSGVAHRRGLQSAGEPLQPHTPAPGRPDGVADTLPAVAVSVYVAVFELDPRAAPPSATNRTSTSLAFAGSVSTCHCRLMSQLKTIRLGGS